MSEVSIDWSISEYIFPLFWFFFWTLVIFWRVSWSILPLSSTIILLASFVPIPLAWVSRFDSPLAIACITSFDPRSSRARAHFGQRPLTLKSLLKIRFSLISSNPMSRDPDSVWWWYIQSFISCQRDLVPMIFGDMLMPYQIPLLRSVISVHSIISSVPMRRLIMMVF